MKVVLVAVLLSVAGADNTADDEKAKNLFDAAAAAYRRGDYATAITVLETAYKIAPKEQILFSLAQACRLQYGTDQDPRRLARAVQHYNTYLERFPTGKRRRHARQHRDVLQTVLDSTLAENPNALAPRVESSLGSFILTTGVPGAKVTIGDEEITEFPDTFDVEPGVHRLELEAPGFVGKHIDIQVPPGATIPIDVALVALPARVVVSAPDGARVTVDGSPVGEAPIARTLEIPAGRHLIGVVQNGHYAFTEEVVVGRGEQTSVVADLEATNQRTVAYVFMGGGAALLGLAALTGVSAIAQQAEAQRLEDKLVTTGLTVEETGVHQASVRQRERATISTAILAGSAVVTGVVGILLYLIDTPRAPNTAAITAAPGGAAATIQGRF